MASHDGKIPADTPSEGRQEFPIAPGLALGPREAKLLNTDGLWPVILGADAGIRGVHYFCLGCRVRSSVS